MDEPVEPQAVTAQLTAAAIFLIVTIDEGGEQVVHDVLADVPDLTRAVGFRSLDGQLSCVVGIGSAAWDRLYGAPRPAELHPFRALEGPRHTAPATPGDVMFHIRATQLGLCFELAGMLMDRLHGAATAVDEVHGFRYFDQRDLLGFVDGTENPTGVAARTATVIGEQDPDFAGGSYAIVQKYVHDLRAWNALPVQEQEAVIGRTKLSDVELDDEAKPSDSHVALTTIEEDDGTERQIIRSNMPFGEVGTGEFGTYFIGYSATPSVTEQMLVNMFTGDPPGNTDRILEFSTAITGCLFFVPAAGFFDDAPGVPARTDGAEPAPPAPTADPSLAIGSLKRGTTP